MFIKSNIICSAADLAKSLPDIGLSLGSVSVHVNPNQNSRQIIRYKEPESLEQQHVQLLRWGKKFPDGATTLTSTGTGLSLSVRECSHQSTPIQIVIKLDNNISSRLVLNNTMFSH